MGDRYNIHSQLEHLQSKYIGTGHADTTKFEWLVNQHRDSSHSQIYFFHGDQDYLLKINAQMVCYTDNMTHLWLVQLATNKEYVQTRKRGSGEIKTVLGSEKQRLVTLNTDTIR
uniref:Splicing factor 3B subunit 5 n=1 Tax=Timema cristinae TaxID=61476 RepID=A0A7R9HDQ7_TIMCR|nr:unnamed protein product [Timema cristinae]